MNKIIFKYLAKFNKFALPSLAHKDPMALNKKDKLLAAYRYWVTTNALD